MPYRILCNAKKRKCPKARSELALTLSRFTPLHKIRYGIEILIVLITILAGIAISIPAYFLREAMLSRSRSKPLKIEVKSSSGDKLMFEVRNDIGEEEINRVAERLESFARQSTHTSAQKRTTIVADFLSPVATPSALAGTLGEMIGEFFGTMVLILFGDGCVATFALFNKVAPNPFANEWVVIIFGWGFAVMFGIYAAGAISGAHINPAVTLALAASGRHPWRKVLPYWLAQVLGAFVAAAILWFVYQGAISNALHGAALSPSNVSAVGGVFYTSPKAFVGTFGAFGDEFLGTALLVGLILAIVDARNQPVQSNLNPLIIGLLIVAIGASFGLNTGYAINPARDLGPRLWIAIVSGGASLSVNNYYFWIPIVAPLTGGVVGAFIYDYTIGKVLIAKELIRVLGILHP